MRAARLQRFLNSQSKKPGGGVLRDYSPAVLILVPLLLLMVTPPLVYLVTASLHETNIDGSFGDFTWDNYANLFGGDRFLRHFANTCAYSLGSALVALLIGGAQAWIVEQIGRAHV